MRRLALRAYETSSSEDSSDDEKTVDASKYAALKLSEGLELSALRQRAIHELHEILVSCYATKASKVIQNAVYSDLLKAVAAQDRRKAVIAAIQDLVKVTEKILPQQKRSQLLSEYKKHSMVAARQAKKQAARHARGFEEDDDDEDIVPLTDLPLPDDITQAIISQLDPCTLARASCVCKSWQKLVARSGLWNIWTHQLYSKRIRNRRKDKHKNQACVGDLSASGSVSNNEFTAKDFNLLVQVDPFPVLPFKAPPRTFVNGSMVWSVHNNGSGTVLNSHSRVVLPTTQQVVKWLLGLWPPKDHQSKYNTRHPFYPAGVHTTITTHPNAYNHSSDDDDDDDDSGSTASDTGTQSENGDGDDIQEAKTSNVQSISTGMNVGSCSTGGVRSVGNDSTSDHMRDHHHVNVPEQSDSTARKPLKLWNLKLKHT